MSRVRVCLYWLLVSKEHAWSFFGCAATLEEMQVSQGEGMLIDRCDFTVNKNFSSFAVIDDTSNNNKKKIDSNIFGDSIRYKYSREEENQADRESRRRKTSKLGLQFFVCCELSRNHVILLFNSLLRSMQIQMN